MMSKRGVQRGLAGAAAMALLAMPALAQQSSVPDAATDIHPLLIGAQVPDATYYRSDGSPFKLREEAAKKPTILIYYRGGW